MRDPVDQVFNIKVVHFMSVASKWLCHTRYVHFYIVSSVVIRTIWNNRNNLVFYHCTWINLKQVWRMALGYLKLWLIPLKEGAEGKLLQFMEVLLAKLKAPLALEPG